jgi:COP9 signalosome complex subunit 6
MVPLHQQILSYNESAIVLCLNPSSGASVVGGGKLPLGIYESIYEAEDSAENVLKLKFVPLKYTIETGEAEMIGVDFVAKGGFGNATAEASGLVGVKETANPTKDGSKKIKLAELFSGDTKGKGKERPTTAEEGSTLALEAVNVGTQNDECMFAIRCW